jgi:hypothetical protein
MPTSPVFASKVETLQSEPFLVSDNIICDKLLFSLPFCLLIFYLGTTHIFCVPANLLFQKRFHQTVLIVLELQPSQVPILVKTIYKSIYKANLWKVPKQIKFI